MRNLIIVALALTSCGLKNSAWAWDPREADKLHANSQESIALFKEMDPSIQNFIDVAAGSLFNDALMTRRLWPAPPRYRRRHQSGSVV